MGRTVARDTKSPRALRVVTALLILAAIVIPPWEAAPQLLVVAETAFGTFSIQRLLVLAASVIVLFAQLQRRNLPKPVWSDLVVFLVLALTIARAGVNQPKAVYWLIMVTGPYVLGRLLWNLMSLSAAKLIAKVGRIVGFWQAGVAVVTIFTGSLWTASFDPRYIDSGWIHVSTIPGIDGAFRATATLGSPVALGAVLTFSLACWLFDPEVKPAIRTVGFSLVSVAILATLSRGAWLASIVIIAVWLVTGRKKLGRVTSALAVTCLVLLGVWLWAPTFIQSVLPRIKMTSYDDFSVSHRLLMVGWATGEWMSSPTTFLTGSGPGSAKLLLLAHPPLDRFPVIDNQYLSMAVEYGSVGLIWLLCSSIVVPAIVGRRANRFSSNERMFLMALVAGVLAIAIDGMFFEFLAWESIGIVFMLCVGVLSSLATVSFAKKRSAGVPSQIQ